MNGFKPDKWSKHHMESMGTAITEAWQGAIIPYPRITRRDATLPCLGKQFCVVQHKQFEACSTKNMVTESNIRTRPSDSVNSQLVKQGEKNKHFKEGVICK